MAARTASPKVTGWVLGTVLLGIVLAAAAWLLAISPVLERADAARMEASTIRDSNELLQVKIDRLKEQFADIEEYRAELAALRTQVPTEAQLAEYLREVDTIAAANGVTVTAITTTLGQLVELPQTAPVAPPADPAAPTDGTAGTEGTQTADGAGTPTGTDGTGTPPGDGTPPPPPAPLVPEGFVAIPLGFSVVGPYENVVAFLEQMQTGTQRLFLVTGFQGDAQEDVQGSGGRPTTAVGDIELYVGGLAYVLTEPAAAAELVDAEETPAPVLPGAVPGKNPLIPVGGNPAP